MDVIISSLCCDVCPSLCSVPWCVSPQQCSKELCPADASCDPCSCGELPREGVHHSLPSWHAAAPTAAPCIREQAKIRFVKWHFINFLARFCKQHKKLTLGKFRDKFGCVFVQLGSWLTSGWKLWWALCVPVQPRQRLQPDVHTHPQPPPPRAHPSSAFSSDSGVSLQPLLLSPGGQRCWLWGLRPPLHRWEPDPVFRSLWGWVMFAVDVGFWALPG